MDNVYGYVYLTYCKVNGKIYIGQKKSNRFIKTYYGSGKKLRFALNKYGKENFETYLICFYRNELELDNAEIFWIDYFKSNDPKIGYNMAIGGRNSRGVSGKNHYNYGKPSFNRGKKESKEQREKISKSLKLTYKKYGKESWTDTHREKFYQAINSRTKEEKIALFKKKSKALIGKNKGKIRIEKGTKIKKIFPEELSYYESLGWIRNIRFRKSGRGNNGKKWINKNNKNKFVYIEEVDNYIKLGWSLGMIKDWKPDEKQREKMSQAQKERFKHESVWNKGLSFKEMKDYGKNR